VLGSGSRYVPQGSLARASDHPRLASLLRRAAARPLVTVTAIPGWGKTTFAAQWAAETGASWCRLVAGDRDLVHLASSLVAAQPGAPALERVDDDPSLLAAAVAERWHEVGPARLVLDDADVLYGARSLELLQRLLRAVGPGSQVLVVSRRALGLVTPRDRADGTVLELDATHLALDTVRVAGLLEAELEVTDRPLAARIVDATGGWPAAVRLVLDALDDVPEGQRSTRLTHLTAADGPVGGYVREVLLPALTPADERLATMLALLGRSHPARLGALLDRPGPAGAELAADLVSRGLARRDFDATSPGVEVLPPLARSLLGGRLEGRPDGAAMIDAVVAGLTAEGEVGRALGVLTEVGRSAAVAALLEDHGADLVHGGELGAVAAAAEALPPDLRTARIERLHAQVLAFRGEWAAALRHLGAAASGDTAAEGDVAEPAGADAESALAVGMVHHLRGDLDAAVAAYASGPDTGDEPVHAALHAWRSTAHWLRGEAEAARRCADAAMTVATRVDDDGVLALAHTAAAMVAASEGDRRANETHYAHALAAARRAGDELQQARILTNQGSRHLESGAYEAALHATDEAIDLADAQGFAMVLGVARCNRAEILLRTGRLDEAVADAEVARDTFARIGSSLESYAHHLLGDTRREQGDLALAQLAYERALQLAAPAGDRQGQVPALVGLARTVVGSDPDAAAEAAERALALDDGMATVSARLALGWIALACDRPDEAAEIAAAAETQAVRREDRAGVAEARTLQAVLDDDPVPGLSEAARLWWEVGARLSATRAELGVARRRPGGQLEAVALERRLVGWGCAPDGGAFSHRTVVGSGLRARLAVRVLGTFVVERDGRPVPRAEWRSKKARELLKVLVVRGGRASTREELADLLWPGEAYEAVANRLSVALSVIRGVLTDAGASRDDSPLRTDDVTVALDTAALEVDLHRFRRLAEEGLRLARTDRPAALELLLAAEEAYGGDLLEDDRDVLWLVDRREELRTLYVSVVRAAAQLIGDEDPDRAMRLLLRVLDRDPYDEPAHLGVCRALLRSGRHGEARRRHRLYADRMAELDLPAVPLHDLVATADPGVTRTG
jgi:ATP/maltotriose-dependent transcriptional regulator MalT/DNA-binding SARP family transcriptional activator